MNIENLEIGKEYKWKELCNALGIKVSEGNSRKKDIKQLETLCRYRKEGQKFIIEEIYKEEIRTENCTNYINKILPSDNNLVSEGGAKNCTEIKKPNKKSNDRNIYYINKEEDLLFNTINKNKYNLDIGTSYSYKKLTELLDIPYLRGNQKEAQLRVVRQLICLEKKNSKYKVVSIYKIPLSKELGNVDNISADTYGNMLLLALYNYVEDNNCKAILDSQGYLFFSRPYLYERMEMCNTEYKESKANKRELANVADVDLDTVHRFYDYNELLFKSNLQKATRNLRSRRFAKIDDDALCIVDTKGNYRLANDKEFALVLEMEKKALDILSYKDMKGVFINHELDDLYKISTKLIKEEIKNKNPKFKSFGKNFDYCYRVIKVITTSNLLKTGYNELLRELEKAKEIANELVLEKNDTYFSNKAKELSEELLPRGVFGREKIEEIRLEYMLAFIDEINILKESLLLIEKSNV